MHAWLVLLAQETGQKRLVLAAAALPVLQVPLHAFSLVVPYLVALLKAFSSQAKEIGKSNSVEAGEGYATASEVNNDALLRQERRGVKTRREARRQLPDRTEAPTSSTDLSTPAAPPPATEQGESQPLGTMAAAATAAATTESRPTAAEDAEAWEKEASETEALEAAKHAAAWVSVFDLCAARLGPSLAAEVLLPPVLATLEG